jgi:hypothetical protein
MIIYSLDMDLLVYSEQTAITGLLLILFGFIANVILWSEKIFNSVIRVTTYSIDQISKFLNKFISLIREILGKIDNSIRIFVQFLGGYYKIILRTFFTMVGIFLVYSGIFTFVKNNQVDLLLGQEIGTHARGWWLLAIGIGFIYFASLSQFNKIFKEIYRDAKKTVNDFIAWFRLHQKTIQLYSQNTIGILFILIGFIVYSPSDLFGFFAIVLGIVILGVTWRTQIKKMLFNFLNEIVKTGNEIIAWFQLFWKTILVYSARILGFVLIIFGFVIIPYEQYTVIGMIMILVGAFIIGITWRTQIRLILIEVYRKTIKTGKKIIKSIKEFISYSYYRFYYYGIRLILKKNYVIILRSSFTLIGAFLIYAGMVTIFTPNRINQFLGQDIGTQASGWWLVATGIGLIYGSSLHQFNRIFKEIYRDFKKGVKDFIAWVQLHRKTIRLYSTRVLGVLVILAGLVLQFTGIFFNLVIIGIGIILISSTWYTQIKQALIYIYNETVKASKQFIAWFQIHRKKIRLYSTRILGTFLILLGFVYQFPVPFLDLIVIGIGIILISSTWFTQIKQVLINIYTEIVKTVIDFITWFKLHWKTIIVYSTRIIGILLIIGGYIYYSEEAFLGFGAIIFGIFLLGLTWRTQIKNSLIYIYSTITKTAMNFFAWFLLHRKIILLSSVRIIGSLLIIIGYFLFYENPPIGIFTVAIGFISLSATWYKEIKVLLVNLYKGIIKTGKEIIAWFRLHRKTIQLYSFRMLGFSLIFIGYLLISRNEFLLLGVFLILLGIGILGITWLTQIKLILISVYTNLKKTILHYAHATYEGFLFLIQFIRDFYIEILRFTLTSFGAIFFFLGFLNKDSLFYLLGSLLILIAWIDLIIKVIVQAIRNLTKFLQDNYIVILRYSISLIGSFLLVIGLSIILITSIVDLSDYVITIYSIEISIIGWVSLPIGLLLNYIAWYKKINPYLLEVFGKISDFTKQFLVSVRDFTSKALTQLKALILSIADSIIPLSILLVSFTAVIVGIILILSGVIDPSGDWTIGIMNLPVVKQITMIIQWDPNPRNLLGVWAEPNSTFSIFQIILGIGFSIVGFILSLLVYLRFEKLKIHNFTASSQES